MCTTHTPFYMTPRPERPREKNCPSTSCGTRHMALPTYMISSGGSRTNGLTDKGPQWSRTSFGTPASAHARRRTNKRASKHKRKRRNKTACAEAQGTGPSQASWAGLQPRPGGGGSRRDPPKGFRGYPSLGGRGSPGTQRDGVKKFSKRTQKIPAFNRTQRGSWGGSGPTHPPPPKKSQKCI